MSSISKLDNVSWGRIIEEFGVLLSPTELPKRVALTALGRSELLIYNGLLGASTMAAWKGASWCADYVYKHQLKDMISLWQEPSIQMKQFSKESSVLASKTGYLGTLWSYYIWGGMPPEKRKAEELPPSPTPCFFNSTIERAVKELAEGIQANVDAGRPLQNVIFYGPPGVGKTMVIEEIARKSGVNYMVLSSSSLRAAIRDGTHLWELEKIFKKMENAKGATVLVIDECELMFTDREILRSQEGTQSAYDLLEAFLKKTGTPSKKFMIVLATNNLRVIDRAILDRMDYQIHVGLPAFAEREKLIRANIPLKFQEADQKVWTDEKINQVAAATEGFSGRCLEKLLTRIAIKRDISPAKELTDEMIEQGVHECMGELLGALLTSNPGLLQQMQHRAEGA